MKKLLFLLLLLVIGVAVLVYGKQPKPFSPQSESARRLQPGPAIVVQYDETFVDTSRSTQANGDYPGDEVRRMEGTLWHPASADDGPYPLIVYSHGFSSSKDGGAYLAKHLASLGYVVISVNYPLTNYNAPGGPNVKDVMNQPADVSFLIDTLLAQSNTPGHKLAGMVDGSRIGVTGISLGGLTTELVTYHPTLRDPRIGAALSIAGPIAIFTKVFFEQVNVPFMMLSGDIDAMVPHASNAAPVLEKIANSQLVTLVNASHTAFAGTASLLRWLNNPDALGCWMVKRNIGNAGAEPWYELIGTEEQGVDRNAVNELCLVDPLPKAMNALRQQMISSVVVSSFFQSHFSASAKERDASRLYLSRSLEKEIPEVRFRQGF